MTDEQVSGEVGRRAVKRGLIIKTQRALRGHQCRSRIKDPQIIAGGAGQLKSSWCTRMIEELGGKKIKQEIISINKRCTNK